MNVNLVVDLIVVVAVDKVDLVVRSVDEVYLTLVVMNKVDLIVRCL